MRTGWLQTYLISVIALTLGAMTPLYPKNQYAKNFELQTFETHKLLTIKSPWRGGEDLTFTYALVDKEHSIPELPQNVAIIRTPVERVILMATVYLGPIQSLGLHDKLVGVAHLNFTNDSEVHQRVKQGKIKEVQGGSAVDIESILQLEPDLILTSSTGNSVYDTYPKLERARLPVVLTAGYMEEHPLARSEWNKVTAAFFDKEAEAEAIFDEIVDRYEALAQLTKGVSDRPTIFANAPYAGVWHLPGGNSYNAQAFRDAGADYLWADDPSRGGVPRDFEVILLKAADADMWINPSSHDSLRSLLHLDSRFTSFKAFREGEVYNNTVRVNGHGGNDIWERGIDRPYEVLADLIKIFHPDLLPDHKFIYYEKLK